MRNWPDFPHDSEKFLYSGDALALNWDTLHRGDCEPYPDQNRVESLLETTPQAAPENFDGNTAELAACLQQCWRDFHAGNFARCVEQADQCGALGAACANKATGIFATYLEPRENRQQLAFREAITRAELAIGLLPEVANSHYFHAFNLGRLSQSISIMEALRKGMGGKIFSSLNKTLELEPEHAEAHTAMGMYHAEIINKVGKMIGGMTYGANAKTALEHFEEALRLTPDSPIAHIEYGNGLYLLFGDAEIDKVSELYIKASEMKPRDAMEALDIEAALAELE